MQGKKSISLIVILFFLIFSGVMVLSPGVFSKGKVCYDCHQEAEKSFAKKFRHQPVKEKECKGCHESHGFAQKLILRKSGSALCFDCHKDLEVTYLEGSVHPPVREGRCLSCHEPHASDEKSLIRPAEAVSFCFMCHQDLEDRLEDQFLHKPFGENQCAVCHAVHNSEFEGLLVAEEEQLCFSCHDRQGEKFVSVHPPEITDLLSCTGCHDPHSSSDQGLRASGAHSPFVDGQCDMCHSLPETGEKPELSGTAARADCRRGVPDLPSGPSLRPKTLVDSESQGTLSDLSRGSGRADGG